MSDHIPRNLDEIKQLSRRNGFDMLLVSVVVIVFTLGLSLGWALRRVYRLARECPTRPAARALLVVLGAPLAADQPTPVYAQRLRRAHTVYQQGLCRRILILGGLTHGHSRSEAAGGRAFLAARGVADERILTEERSQNTLENLRNACAKVEAMRDQPFVLVTSRCHLARGIAVARGLGLRPEPCAAEDELRLDAPTLKWLLREAFGLHWYELDLWWSRRSRDPERLRRIT